MVNNLIGEDIKLWRKRYDEALNLRGIPVKYQYPLMPESNQHGEAVVEAYSDMVDTFIFFEGNPKLKTFKRLGWVVENDSNLPFLIHCSFNLPKVQKDSIFHISGQYSEVDDRIFKVVEISYDLQAPDHIVCQVVPVYDKDVVGLTSVEISKKFDKSNYFLKQDVDYRGHHYTTKKDVE